MDANPALHALVFRITVCLTDTRYGSILPLSNPSDAGTNRNMVYYQRILLKTRSS
jgi:hypothetical protein